MGLELPSISASSYGTSTVTSAGVMHDVFLASDTMMKPVVQPRGGAKYHEDVALTNFGLAKASEAVSLNTTKAIGKQMSKARIVKVFIADPDENLPLEKRVVYTGIEKLTDLDDQELFFEINIKLLLDEHNKTRKATVDKKSSEKFGREIMLEATRIRDLKMVVVTVAAF